jgi:type IV pilus assembly protein PilB
MAGRRGGRLGEILVSEGKVSPGQLREALELQRADGRDLGEILVSLGHVLPADLARALAKRLKLDFVVLSELKEGEFDPAALRGFDEATLRRYPALPLRFEGDRLVVAMSDPNDILALEDLRLIARRELRPVVVTPEDLEGALDHLFGADREGETPGAGETSEEPGATAATEQLEGAPGLGESVGAGEGPAAYVAEATEGARAVEEVRAAYGPRSRLVGLGAARIGDILVADGVISEGQLAEALERQREDRREIGKILLSLGYVGKADLARALARRLRLDYVELTERDVDRGVAMLVDGKVQRRYGVVPLRMEGNRLVVAMSDPTNVQALEDLALITGLPVTPVVASEDEIRQVHAKLFAITEEVSEFLEEAGREALSEGDVGEIALGEHTPDEAPIIRLVSSILQQAVGDGASDVHVEPRARELVVRMRVDGVLREVMSIPPKLQSGVIARLKIVANLDIAERRVPQDGRFSVRLGGQKLDLRVASLPTVYGEKIVLRLLDTAGAAVELTELGFSSEVYGRYEEVFRRPYGTILVTGPTGSGKSTTLYATLNELNTPERNIITVEDPVEYRMSGVNQIQTNPRAGLTFASALRSILRADPDVLMVGEIRDRETAKIAVEAALTGHLVLATLHTNDAPGALNRLTDMGVEPFLTASAVDCVIAQRLARRLCESCKEPVDADPTILAGLNFPTELMPDEPRFHRAVGCGRCGGTGYRGRIGVYELMIVGDAIREMILRRDSAREIARVAEGEGMVRLRDDGLLKAARGLTTVEEVLRTVV